MDYNCLLLKTVNQINFRVLEGEHAAGRIPRHDVPHHPHGSHITGGGGGGGSVLPSLGEDQGDHDQLSEGDCGEHPEFPPDRERDIPRVQGF